MIATEWKPVNTPSEGHAAYLADIRQHCSIGIVTRDRPDALGDTLHKLRLVGLEGTPLLVVDDSGNPGPIVRLVESWPNGRFYRGRAAGYVAARMDQMRYCRNELMIFLDDDAYFLDTTGLPEVVRRLRQSRNVAAAAFRVLTIKPDRWELSASLAGETAWFQSGACIIKVKAALEAGGYSDAFKYGAEDFDLSCRLYQKGYSAVSHPTVTVEHLYYQAERGSGGEAYMDYHFARGQATSKWRNFPLGAVFLESMVYMLRVLLQRPANARSRLRGCFSGIRLGWLLRNRSSVMHLSQYARFRMLMLASARPSQQVEKSRAPLHALLQASSTPRVQVAAGVQV